MRQADIDEVMAATGHAPLEALVASLKVSRNPIAGLVNGEVAAVCGIGCRTFTSRAGVPWLLGSDLIEKHARAFLRLSRAYIDEARAEYRYLSNFVDARNASAIRWLRWLGFTIESPVPYGMDQLPFHHFYMGEPNV